MADKLFPNYGGVHPRTQAADINKYWGNPLLRYENHRGALDVIREAREAFHNHMSGTEEEPVRHHNVNSMRVYTDGRYSTGFHACHYVLQYFYTGDVNNKRGAEFIFFPTVIPSMRTNCKSICDINTAVTEKHIDAFLADESEDAKALRKYHKWLLEDPLMSTAFWPVDSYRDALKYGVIVNADAPSVLAITACIAMRTPREFPSSLRLWYYLTEGGMTGWEAFCYYFSPKSIEEKWYYYPDGQHHGPVDVSMMTWPSILQAAANDFKFKGDRKRTLRKNGYERVQEFWCNVPGLKGEFRPVPEWPWLPKGDKVIEYKSVDWFDGTTTTVKHRVWDSIQDMATAMCNMHFNLMELENDKAS